MSGVSCYFSYQIICGSGSGTTTEWKKLLYWASTIPRNEVGPSSSGLEMKSPPLAFLFPGLHILHYASSLQNGIGRYFEIRDNLNHGQLTFSERLSFKSLPLYLYGE